jgi:hypothetical protein
MELDLQCDMDLIRFDMFDSVTFINCLPVDKFPELGDHTRRMTSFFEGINVYEQFFSK